MSKQVFIMPLPGDARGAYSIAGVSGGLAATLAAGDILFSFQWTDPTHQAIIHDVTTSVAVSSTISTAVATGIELVAVRDFWTAHTGGTDLHTVGVTGHEEKRNSQFATSLVGDIRIANTAPLGLPLVPGTEDGVVMGQTIFGTGTTAGAANASQNIDLLAQHGNDYPFILHQYEGFVIRMALNGPATGALRLSVHVGWYETRKAVL